MAELAQSNSVESSKLENLAGCSTEEIQWWLSQFQKGRCLFNQLYDFDNYPSVCFAPSYSGKDNLVTYVYELEQVIVTFNALKNSIVSKRKVDSGDSSRRVTTPHLSRISVCTTPENMPIITGIEEQSHYFFHQVIEPSMSPDHIKKTNLYDGSDTSEEFAFQSIIQAIFKSSDLQIDPIPNNLSSRI